MQTVKHVNRESNNSERQHRNAKRTWRRGPGISEKALMRRRCSSRILPVKWAPRERKGVSVLREGAGRTAGVKEHCLLYCGCSTGCYHEELWGIRAGENVCCLEENSDKTRRRLILNNSILDNNKFRFYTAAKISSMDWLQNYLASLLKIQISGQRSGYSNLFGQ